MKKSRIAFWIVFPILCILIGLLMFFYIDMANGNILWLFVAIGIYITFIVLRIILRNKKAYIRQIATSILILGSVIIVGFDKPKVISKPATNATNLIKTEVISTDKGDIQGVYNKDNTVEVYAGIPYAKPPVGSLRWKEPEDMDNWSGILDCSHFKAKSMQPSSYEVMNSLVDLYAQKAWHVDLTEGETQECSEDSLYLNVWKPTGDVSNLPVLVYIHGGSLTSGSSASDNFNGEEMAKMGIVMVTIQYRLGVFGYFAHDELINESVNHTTGNYGLLDQIKALEWVNRNCEAFGGDKSNITIAGESAGSSSVSALCVSKLAKGLFKKAIGESSSIAIKLPPHTFRKMDVAKETGNDILKEFNCTSVNELRNVKATDLVKTKYKNECMTLDGYALDRMPYDVYKANDNNEEALLNGYNVKESDAFVVPRYLFNPTNKSNIKNRLIEVFGDNIGTQIYNLYSNEIELDAFSAFNEIISVYWFIHPHYSWSNLAYDSGVKVYKYQFTKENGYYGTYHSGEIIYAYGNVKNAKNSYCYDDSDLLLSNNMLSYWANFCKNGNPNGILLPTWDLYNKTDNKVMELGLNCSMIDDKYKA
ncbi:MAG: carboxylesterase family protein, partial [Acholeplasmatales bacterium]|nr:carboxylesterase family protein [Acholeplasmatales bacterium]